MSKSAIFPVTPWLIQRCKLDNEGKLRYDYMGSSEFEWGDQAEALKKLFSGKIRLPQVFVQAKDGGAPVGVYLIMQADFDVTKYQQHLQCLAEDKMQLQEAARFGEHVTWKATRQKPRFGSEWDVWFDFTKRGGQQNIVLWTLSEERRDALLARLKVITDKWAKDEKERKPHHPM